MSPATPEHAPSPPASSPRGGRRFGRAGFPPEIVEAARRLLEETALPLAAVAERTGVSGGTIWLWRKRHGWRRPPDAPGALPKPRPDGRARPSRYRSGKGRPYAADTVAEAELLLTRTLLSQKAIADRMAVSQAWLGRIMRRRGWVRPEVPSWSKRWAAAKRTAVLRQEGDRRGRPYAPAVRREARILWEDSRLPTLLIAARLGVDASTIADWSRREAWTRPPGRVGRPQLRGFFGTMARRG